MVKHWTLSLTCPTCSTAVRYEDEIPNFVIDAEMQSAIEAAARWVRENPTTPQQGVALRCPIFAGHTHGSGGSSSTVRTFTLPVDPRFILCPVCDSRIYLSPIARTALNLGAW